MQRLNGGPNWIRFGHRSRSEDEIETEAVFPGANRLFGFLLLVLETKEILDFITTIR